MQPDEPLQNQNQSNNTDTPEASTDSVNTAPTQTNSIPTVNALYGDGGLPVQDAPKSNKKLIIILSVVFVLMASSITAGYIAFANQKRTNSSASLTTEDKSQTNEENQDKQKAVKTAIEYKKLKQLTADGGKVTLMAPEELKQFDYPNSSSSAIISLSVAHTKEKPAYKYDVYTMIAVAKESFTAKDMPAIKAALLDVIRTNPQDYKAEIKKQILAEDKENVLKSVSVGDFTISTDKNRFWVDVETVDKLGTLAKSKIIAFIGKSEVYSVTIGAETTIWQANQQIFQEIIDSIQVK